jgi:hypothetical protein
MAAGPKIQAKEKGHTYSIIPPIFPPNKKKIIRTESEDNL